MLAIRPGVNVDAVIQYLQQAESQARNLRGSTDTHNKLANYFEWVALQQRALGSAVPVADMDRLVSTRTYWSLLGATYMSLAVVDTELQQRIDDLEKERLSLVSEMDRLKRNSANTIAVLDTNVIMTHHHELETMSWHTIADEHPRRTVRVVIPIIVIDELDRLKRSQGDMIVGGHRTPRRTVARKAIRVLSRMFEYPGVSHDIDQGVPGDMNTKPVSFELLMDSAGHARLPEPDAEIRERALALSAYASRLVLVTFDLGNKFAAEHAGLTVNRLVEVEDQNLEPSGTP
jgi:hypothetical protein